MYKNVSVRAGVVSMLGEKKLDGLERRHKAKSVPVV